MQFAVSLGYSVRIFFLCNLRYSYSPQPPYAPLRAETARNAKNKP